MLMLSDTLDNDTSLKNGTVVVVVVVCVSIVIYIYIYIYIYRYLHSQALAFTAVIPEIISDTCLTRLSVL